MAAITTERIFAAADQLDAEGENPTYKAVIKRLGGGSYSTISEAMTQWKAKKAAKERPATEPAPEALAVYLSDFGGQVWALALEFAGKRYTADREALEAARAELEKEKAEALEAADELAAELEATKAQVTALEAAELAARKDAEAAKLEAKKEAEATQAQVAGIIERATTAETRAQEIEKRANDLNAELERMHQANADLVKALAAVGKKPAEKAH